MDLARAVASSYSQEKDPLVGFVLPPDNSGVVADIGFGTPPNVSAWYGMLLNQRPG